VYGDSIQFVGVVSSRPTLVEYGYQLPSLADSCCKFIAQRTKEFEAYSLATLPQELTNEIELLRTEHTPARKERSSSELGLWRSMARDWPILLPLIIWNVARLAECAHEVCLALQSQ
jgi:hypothetical protein